LRCDKSFFTVQELVGLIEAIEGIDEPTWCQLLNDTVKYPYYDALAMWLDTPQWMKREKLSMVFMNLLRMDRSTDEPMIVTEEDLHFRFHQYLRAAGQPKRRADFNNALQHGLTKQDALLATSVQYMLPWNLAEMMVAGLSLDEALWTYRGKDQASFRKHLICKLEELEQLLIS